jgi:hypothetical protein
VAAAVLALAGPAPADSITLGVKSLEDLLGAGPTAVDSVLSTAMNQGNIHAACLSQAYTDGDGHYVYLYQISNTGVTGNSPIEEFTLWPFAGANNFSDIGCLNETPIGFLGAPDQAPESDAWVEGLASGPQISIYYSLRYHYSVAIGEHSEIMYVASDLPPDVITGSVIDGSVAMGDVVGPLPEPATLTFLAAGGLVALARRRRR